MKVAGQIAMAAQVSTDEVSVLQELLRIRHIQLDNP